MLLFFFFLNQGAFLVQFFDLCAEALQARFNFRQLDVAGLIKSKPARFLAGLWFDLAFLFPAQLPVVIAEINQQTRGWGQYFKLGYPAQVFRRSNGAILTRLQPHI